MSQIISVSTITYDGYDLGTTLKNISGIGQKYVELDAIEGLSEHIKSTDLQDSVFEKKVNDMMGQFNLASIAFSGHTDLSKEGAVSAFEKKMKFAKKIGARIINTFSGPAQRTDSFYRNIKCIEKLAKSMDLVVALETHGDIISDKSSIGVIEKINSENVKINYDFVNTFHAAKGEIDLEDDFKSVLPCVEYLHIKDTVLKEDKWHATEVGKGIIDYERIFKVLKKSHRMIPMSIELPLRLEIKKETAIAQKSKSLLGIDQINWIVSNSISYVRKLWESV